MSTALQTGHFPQTTLDRRRVYIFPTRYGFILGLMLLAILLGSINYDNALGYLLTFLLVSLYLTAILHTYHNLTAITCLGVDAEPVFAGQRAEFVVSIENNTAAERFCLALGFAAKRRGWFQKRAPDTAQLGRLAGNGIGRCKLCIDSTSRGWLEPPRIRISSTFPLGILVAWAYFPAGRPCLIYPNPVGDAGLPVEVPRHDGEAAGSGPGIDDFDGVRPYSRGDRARDISWKNLAKHDALVVNRFTGQANDELWLSWRDTAHLDDVEARLSQLALWVVIAARSGRHFGLSLPDKTIAVAAGDGQRDLCLAALAQH